MRTGMVIGVWVLAGALVGCDGDAAQGPPTADAQAPAAKPRQPSAAEKVCEGLFGAPSRRLAKTCSAEDKKQREHGVTYLTGLAAPRVSACVGALEPGLASGRLKLADDAVAACRKALESRSWKDSLYSLSLAHVPECQGLAKGTQTEGKPCRVSAECAEGLWCAGARWGRDGKCHQLGGVGQPCDRPLFALGGADERSCAAGAVCNLPRSKRLFPLGRPRFEPPSEAADGGAPAPVAATAEPGFPPPSRDDAEAHRARQQALRDAAEFGMIGLLNAGVPEPVPSYPPPLRDFEGLDALARSMPLSVGHSEGWDGNLWGDPAPGYGSSSPGRLGRGPRGKLPRVRMGATSVSGRLPPEVIQRIVRQNFGRFRLCYENGLRNNPTLQGRVVVRFVIGRDGEVSNVGGGGDLPDGGVVSCVTRAFYGLSFPKPEGGIVTVSYPIVFTPGDGVVRGPTKPPAEPPAASASASPLDSPPVPVTRPTDGLPYRCVAARTADQPCTSNAQCDVGLVCRAGTCTDASARASKGDQCLDQLDCELGLYCAPSEEGSFVGTCQARKSTGTPCNSSLQCQGYCPGAGQCAALCGEG